VVPLGLEGGAQVKEPWGRPTQREAFGGYDCEFVEPPASAFQTQCPVCRLILRDPYLIDVVALASVKHVFNDSKPIPVQNAMANLMLLQTWD